MANQKQITARLVAKGASLKLKIANQLAELKAVEAELINLGKGKYEGPKGQSCQVVQQSAGATKYELAEKDLAEARKLTGKQFPLIFDVVTTHQPCSGFVDLVPKLLPGNAAAVLALCGRPGKAGSTYVKWA